MDTAIKQSLMSMQICLILSNSNEHPKNGHLAVRMQYQDNKSFILVNQVFQVGRDSLRYAVMHHRYYSSSGDGPRQGRITFSVRPFGHSETNEGSRPHHSRNTKERPPSQTECSFHRTGWPPAPSLRAFLFLNEFKEIHFIPFHEKNQMNSSKAVFIPE
jgi:hypothetical protein